MVLFSQDNYTFAQPGIQMKVNALKELIQRIDGKKNVERASVVLDSYEI